jgi:chromate transport protein ChrA
MRSEKKRKNQYRVLAIVWSFAALSMLAAVLRQIPNVSVFALIILALSVAAAAIWWSAYLKASKTSIQTNDSEERKP